MKKLLSLILCLMALFTCALAETETVELYTIDFGAFTMDLGENDYYEVAEEMVANNVYAIIYPNYDPTAATFDNINITWLDMDLAPIVRLAGAEPYAQMVLEAAAPQYESMGIKMNKAELLSAVFEENVFVTITACELDYAGAGVDLVSPLYQMQVYFCQGEGGTYVFTVSATTMESLEALSTYVDGVVIK